MLNDLLRVNHEEAGGGDFQPLPVGEYEAIVSEVEITQSQAGNPMLKLQLTVRDDIAQEGKKRKFFDNVVFMEKTKWKVQQVYKAFGFTDGHSFNSLEEIAKAIQFKPVRLKNKHEEYNGKTQDRVDFYMQTQNPTAATYQAETKDPFALPDQAEVNDVKPPFEV